MCGIMVATTIAEALQDKVNAGEVFTAYDVTLAARQVTSETVLHNDVRNIVSNAFITGEMGDYNREMHEIDGSGGSRALVYFPDGKTAADHPKVKSSDDGDGMVLDATAEGRVNSPQKVLNQVGMTGGTYDFTMNGQAFFRSPNKDGRVRLTLSELGITDGKCRVVADIQNATIKIESV